MAEIEFLPLPKKDPEPQQMEIPIPEAEPVRTSFRTLTPEEIARECGPDYAKSGNPLPDPAISAFVGAFAGDQLLAYLCLQVKLHAQPLVIRPGNASVLSGLVHAAETHILATTGPQWVYLFTPAGKMAQMASAMGMQTEPWVVMSKLVAPEAPAKPVFEVIPPEAHESGPIFDDTYQARPNERAWDAFPEGQLQ